MCMCVCPRLLMPLGDTVFHPRFSVTAVQWSHDTWMLEYGHGFIPSTMPFAMSDSLFSTNDFYTIYKYFKVESLARAVA